MELYAGLSLDIMLEINGCYIVPWDRVSQSVRKDLVDAVKLKENGGTGRAKEFCEFCEKTKDYK